MSGIKLWPPCQDLGLVPLPLEDRQRLLERRRGKVFEAGGVHQLLLSVGRRRPTVAADMRRISLLFRTGVDLVR
jgi:hypothetical protein